MIISLLFSEPTLFFLWLLAIVYGITVHEFSHVLAAYLQGDDTGRLMGRLTLNPAAHIEPFGMLLLLVVGFGWGRPAPFNPHNLKYRRWGEVAVALAGPASNLASVAVFMVAVNILAPVLGPFNLLIQLLGFLILINIVLLAFNLIPIPPLDGSTLLFELLPDRYARFKAMLARNGPWILLMLIFADNFLGINIFGRVFGVFFRLAGLV
ncbi:MAG: site-2 protease family protein [Parcubacteria group bacterium]|nr:site-2 protease family protein [Parcubacteria group bacterium]